MHLEVLKSEQREIFLKLRRLPEFYLVGGTALALQIKHRIYIDFDLFSKKNIPQNLLVKVRRIFSGLKVKVIVNHSEQLSVRIKGIKVDFVKYKFPLVLKPIIFEGVKIVSIREIAAMKAYTLNQRGTLKDYVDLYFILKERYSTLERIKKIAEKKYESEFNFRLFLEQLIYLEDVKEMDIQYIKEPIGKEEIKNFFQKEVKKIKL